MQARPDLLKSFDKPGMALVESGFIAGPLADAARAAPEIRRRARLTATEFEAEHRTPRRPVVLQGMVDDWPALKTWGFNYFANHYGSQKVTVDAYNSARAREMSLAQFVQLLEQQPSEGGAPVYLQEWYYKAADPLLALDTPELEVAQYDFRRELYGEAISTNHQLWAGQRGGVTILHQDAYLVDVMHIQLVGEKRWIVMAPEAHLHSLDGGQPDFARLAADPAAQLMQCTLRPGDVLFLPSQWWHRVELLSDSIGVGRKCLDPSNLRKHVRLRMGELLCLALNREEVHHTHPELFNVALSRARTLARRMDVDLSKLRP
ncbi:MAG: cupin-like domain-containing protein [Bdellovibrionales bacterium]|nr:cupin-like domain-containing protein [Ramlibacter sp.]